MNENIILPKSRVNQWLCRLLETATWLISLGLLAASLAVAGLGTVAWLISGSDSLLAAGLGGGVVLGLAGVWQLLCLIDKLANRLRLPEPSKQA